METATFNSPVEKQPVIWRMFWFVVGGFLSLALNLGILSAMRKLGLSDSAGYAVTVLCVAMLLAVWNYRVNFRTQRNWKECLFRYVIVVIACALVDYSIVSTNIKQWGRWWALLILCAKMFVGVLKFLIYHFWAYRHADEAVTPPA